MQPNRVDPVLPAHAMKTYQIAAPLASHWRPATCAEVACPHQAHGWRTVVDERTDLGQVQAHYIRRESGRRFGEQHGQAGLTVFEFAPGQRCFAQHQQRLDREELFVVRGGDWRGDPRGLGTFRHTTPESWTDDFATHQQTLADRLDQG